MLKILRTMLIPAMLATCLHAQAEYFDPGDPVDKGHVYDDAPLYSRTDPFGVALLTNLSARLDALTPYSADERAALQAYADNAASTNAAAARSYAYGLTLPLSASITSVGGRVTVLEAVVSGGVVTPAGLAASESALMAYADAAGAAAVTASLTNTESRVADAERRLQNRIDALPNSTNQLTQLLTEVSSSALSASTTNLEFLAALGSRVLVDRLQENPLSQYGIRAYEPGFIAREQIVPASNVTWYATINPAALYTGTAEDIEILSAVSPLFNSIHSYYSPAEYGAFSLASQYGAVFYTNSLVMSADWLTRGSLVRTGITFYPKEVPPDATAFTIEARFSGADTNFTFATFTAVPESPVSFTNTYPLADYLDSRDIIVYDAVRTGLVSVVSNDLSVLAGVVVSNSGAIAALSGIVVSNSDYAVQLASNITAVSSNLIGVSVALTNHVAGVADGLTNLITLTEDKLVPTNRTITVGNQVGSLESNLVFESSGGGVDEPTVTNIAQAVASAYVPTNSTEYTTTVSNATAAIKLNEYGSLAVGEGSSATGQNSYSLGVSEASGDYSYGFGGYATGIGSVAFQEGRASEITSMAIGLLAYATNRYSFVWNGKSIVFGIYGSHGDRTFNVNPNLGTSGFYIGGTNLQTYLNQRVEKSDGTATNLSVSGTLNLNGEQVISAAGVTNVAISLQQLLATSYGYGSITSTVAGAYLLTNAPPTGPMVTITNNATTNGAYVARFITGTGLRITRISGSQVIVNFSAAKGAAGACTLKPEFYLTDSNGVKIVEFENATETAPLKTSSTPYSIPIIIPSNLTITASNRIGVYLKATVTSGTPTVYVYTEDARNFSLSVPTPSAEFVTQSQLNNYYTKAEIDATSSAPYMAWTGTIIPANGTATVTYAHGNMPQLMITSPTVITLDPTGYGTNGVSRISLSLFSGTNSVTLATNVITYATTPTISTNCWNTILIRRVSNCAWKGVGL